MTHPSAVSAFQFRPAALGQRPDNQTSVLAIRPYLSTWVLAGYCVLLLVSALFLLQVQFTDKVRAAGVTQPFQQPVLLTAVDGGHVAKVNVEENELVQKGQVLAVIAIGGRGAGGQLLDDHATAKLKLKRESLMADLKRFRSDAYATDLRLRAQRTKLKEQEQSAADNVNILKRRAALMAAERERLNHLLAERWISPFEARRAEIEQLEAEHALVIGRRDLIQAGGNLLLLDDQIATGKATNAQTAARLEVEIAVVTQELHQLSAHAQRAVVAPFAGRVADLQVYVGQQLKAGEHLASVVPPEVDAHSVVMWLPASAGGRVREGMAVRLTYAGYPATEHGFGTGTIERISPVARAVAAGVWRYRARVAVNKLPREADRIPAGMTVDAEVILARKSLWVWLAEPLLEALRQI